MSEQQLVSLIDWLINYYPGKDHLSISDSSTEYYSKIRQLFDYTGDSNIPQIVSRCINGVMDKDGFQFSDLKREWNKSISMNSIERLKYISTLPWMKHIKVSKLPDFDNFKQLHPEVKVVIDVSDSGGIFQNRKFSELEILYFWFPMSERNMDMGINSLFGALVVLHDCRKKGLRPLIHCIQGQNRSVTVHQAFLLMNGEIKESNCKQLFSNCNGIQLPYPDNMIKFLGKVRDYLDSKVFFQGTPLDFCKQVLV